MPVPPKAKPKAKAKAGRPRFVIDYEVVERSALMGCNTSEIATLVGMGHAGFYRRMEKDKKLANAVLVGRDKGCATIRRLQWHAAVKGSIPMMIWLGKQMLGQREKLDTANQTLGADGNPVDPVPLVQVYLPSNKRE